MTSSANKLVYLESLRGLAAMVVVFAHLFVVFYPAVYEPPRLAHSLWGVNWVIVFISGSYAVRLFFFLSGFVLAISYFRSQQVATLSSAALRRYPRLMLPVFATVLFAWIIQEFHGYRNIGADALIHPLGIDWLSRVYTQHISGIEALKQGLFNVFFNYSEDRSLNGVLWTMSIELAGSFFVFSFLALFGGLRKRYLIYIFGACLLHFTGQPYMLDFLGGMALSDLFINYEKSNRKIQASLWASFLLMMIGVTLGGLSMIAPEVPSLFYIPSIFNMPTLASLLIVGAAVFSSPMQTILEHSVFAFLGRISFPLYLFHVPILCSLGCGFYIYLRTAAFSHMTASLFSSVLVTGTSILVAWGAYYAIELPSIRASKKFSQFFYPSRPGDLEAERPDIYRASIGNREKAQVSSQKEERAQKIES